MSQQFACLLAILTITLTLIACGGQGRPRSDNADVPAGQERADAGSTAPTPATADKSPADHAAPPRREEPSGPAAKPTGDRPPAGSEAPTGEAGEKSEAATNAGDLCAAFASDPAGARRTFLKQRIRVAGRVVQSGKSPDTGSPFLVLAKATDDDNTVRCSLKPGMNANGYRKGDTVTLIGTCGDYTVMTANDFPAVAKGLPDKWAIVWLDDCEPVSDGKPAEAAPTKPDPAAEAHKREEAKKAAEEDARHKAEDEAARKVKLAKRLFADADDAHFARRAEDEQRLRREANAVLREVVEKYPATKGAAEAKKLLGDDE